MLLHICALVAERRQQKAVGGGRQAGTGTVNDQRADGDEGWGGRGVAMAASRAGGRVSFYGGRRKDGSEGMVTYMKNVALKALVPAFLWRTLPSRSSLTATAPLPPSYLLPATCLSSGMRAWRVNGALFACEGDASKRLHSAAFERCAASAS